MLDTVAKQHRQTALLLNRQAATAKTDDGLLERRVDELGIELLDPAWPDGADAGAEFISSLVASGVETVLIAGGDGSVHYLVNRLLPNEVPLKLGVIPMGTGNDLARSLALPLAPLDSLDALGSLRATAIDIIRVRSDGDVYHLVNAATGGFGAEVTNQIDPTTKERWGAAAYWLTALNVYRDLTPYHVTIEADGERYDETVYGLALGNGCYAGGGFVVAPNAKLNDGMLHVSMLPILPTLDFLATSLELTVAGQLESERLISFQAASVRLMSEPAIPVSVDGELRTISKAHFEVLPGRLSFLHGSSAAIDTGND